MKNIEETMHPFLVVMCLCGFGVFEYPRGQPRLYLTIFYILISWLFYIYALIQTNLYLNKYNMDLFLITKTNIIFAILTILLSLCYNQKLKTCLRKLSIVNDTLEKLGTPKDYVKLRKLIIRLIVAWITALFFMNMIDSIWFFEHIPSSYAVIGIGLSFTVNQALHINALSDLFYMMLLRYIGSRFEEINQHIENLTKEKKQVERTWITSSFALVRRYTVGIDIPKRIILILMHVHLELCLVTHELTKIFGVHMVMQIFAFNIFTAQLVNEFHTTIIESDIESTYEIIINIFVSYVWIATNIVKIIAFNCICEEISGKVKKTIICLNKLANYILDIKTQEYIIQFLYQLFHRPLRISGLGLHFGYAFLRQCVTYIGTVITVTLQSRPYDAHSSDK